MEDKQIEKEVQHKRSSKRAAVIIAVVLLIAVAGSVIGLIYSLKGKETSAVPLPTPKQVVKENAINGTGMIEGNDIRDISSSVIGDVQWAGFEEGQDINAGDVLYTIDTRDIQNNISKAQLALEKAKLANQLVNEDMGKLNITAPISGTVQTLYVNNGDSVAVNAKIADIINDSNMILKVPFIEDDAQNLYTGAAAQVSVADTAYSMNGTVTKITSGHTVSATGNPVRIVEITVANPGALKKGDKGTAIIGDIACNDAGEFEYAGSETVIAKVAGQVAYKAVSVGDHVDAGRQIVTLSNDTLDSNRRQNEVSIKDAELAIRMQQEQLDKYTIKAPISGRVTSKLVKAGDKISAANSTKLATIVDLSQMIFHMNVDELDVPQIQLGQTVTFTADSMPGRIYTGVVDYIDTAGVQMNGVTLYPVKVVIQDNDGSLLVGMNVTAKISLGGTEQ